MSSSTVSLVSTVHLFPKQNKEFITLGSLKFSTCIFLLYNLPTAWLSVRDDLTAEEHYFFRCLQPYLVSSVALTKSKL